jgi:hypothetical protein
MLDFQKPEFVWLFALILFGVASAITPLCSAGDHGSSELPPGQSNPDSRSSEEYWTPDRLKRAKPRDLPQAPVPTTPPSVQEPGQSRSFERGGSPGEGVMPSDKIRRE